MSGGKVGVIIPAGGSGSRMGGVYKPLEMLCGKPMLCYSLETFEKIDEVSFVVISARHDKINEIEKLCRDNQFLKVKCVVNGGSDRQSSVENAFKCGLFDDDNVDYVAIHDAARPLLDVDTAVCAFETAKKHSNAVCASPVRDTVKRTDDENVVCTNVERDNLWLIQTPQVFEKEQYRKALNFAVRTGFSATDDSSLIINMGEKIHLCKSPSTNFKVTYEEDAFMAQAIIYYRKGGV